jgi:anti-sigma regulatory factor (Ser/Thr protein kinase)
MVRELQREYRPASTSPADARSDVAVYLVEVGHSELIPVAAVLVSELVTNSVVHAEGVVTLWARWAGEVLRVDVSDHGGGVRVASDSDVSGRGLAIVDALATDWGVTRFDGTGRVTWFELR